ncbi:sensor histidine kinase [Cryobacterium sp. BB307]|uniref:sensor histidine kinase n=1 Tax=Cryobacterium sp. BB307 TaxID=2716317 RepID=UPI0014473174|nr:sensor histidine kinase [Cryobacterium sp. BB307]
MATDEWVRERPGPDGYRRDALAAFVLMIGTALSSMLYNRIGWYNDPAPLWMSALAVVGLTAPLAFRRRWPEAVAFFIAIAFYVSQQFMVPELLFSNIALFMAIYTVGAWGRNRRRANVVRGIIIAAMLVWVVVNLIVTVSDPDAVPDFSRSGIFSQLASLAIIQVVTNLLYFGGAFFFGNTAWRAAREKALLSARTAELSEERERRAVQAVALDRLRIARELHDVVAHHVSVMGIQAGAARRVLQTDPAQASASLELIETSARTAVDELHRLLTTLRENETDTASESASTRGVEQLEELAEQTRHAGTPVSVQVIGDPVPLSPLVSFTLFRVAQEALTNTRKHAGTGATADVRLRYEPDAVELEVADTGLGRAAAARGSGLGQVGMRERVVAVGGDLEVGPRSRGGYLVRARIPLMSSRTLAARSAEHA